MTDPEAQEEFRTICRQLRDAMRLLETAESGLIGSQHQAWEQKREELEDEIDLKKLNKLI